MAEPAPDPVHDAGTRAAARRILAVDGGQSAIRVLHSDGGRIELEGLSRSSEVDFQVAEAVERAWQQLGSPPVDRAVLGLTTAPSDESPALALGALVGEGIGAPEVWVCDDSVTSHAGALSLDWGVSIVAGTGVACLAVPPRGEPRIIGGHGYLLGDEGGAYWIGREGIRAVLRAAEGREDQTSLTYLAGERYGGRIRDLHVRLHDDLRPVNTIAQFSREVLEVADTDPAAMRIIRDAAWELFNVILSAAKLLGSELVPVGIGGRLLVDENPLRRELDALLASDGAVRARTADMSPLDGAMLLGSQEDPGRYAPLVSVWRAEDAA